MRAPARSETGRRVGPTPRRERHKGWECRRGKVNRLRQGMGALGRSAVSEVFFYSRAQVMEPQRCRERGGGYHNGRNKSDSKNNFLLSLPLSS